MLSTKIATGRLFEGSVTLVLRPVRGFIYVPVSGGVIGFVVSMGFSVVVSEISVVVDTGDVELVVVSGGDGISVVLGFSVRPPSSVVCLFPLPPQHIALAQNDATMAIVKIISNICLSSFFIERTSFLFLCSGRHAPVLLYAACVIYMLPHIRKKVKYILYGNNYKIPLETPSFFTLFPFFAEIRKKVGQLFCTFFRKNAFGYGRRVVEAERKRFLA